MLSLVPSPLRCDICGKPINAPADGNLVWINYHSQNFAIRSRGDHLSLIHQTRASPWRDTTPCLTHFSQEHCGEGRSLADISLDRLDGHDGVCVFLDLLKERAVPTAQLVEMFQRLYVPDYEMVRLAIPAAIAAGVIPEDRRERTCSAEHIAAVKALLEEDPNCAAPPVPRQ